MDGACPQEWRTVSSEDQNVYFPLKCEGNIPTGEYMLKDKLHETSLKKKKIRNKIRGFYKLYILLKNLNLNFCY